MNWGHSTPSGATSNTVERHGKIKWRSAVEPRHFQASAGPANTLGLGGLQSFLPPQLPPAVGQEFCSELPCLKNNVPQCQKTICCSLTFRNAKINIPYPILAILLFWSIASDTQCILMHGFMITSKPYSLLLQFYRSNLVGYSTEILLNREILLDLNLKLLNCYLLLPLFIRILGTRTAWKVNVGAVKQMLQYFVFPVFFL